MIKRSISKKFINNTLSRKIPSPAERHFSTGISMITSRGSSGTNVMTAEWVMQISYDPILVMALIHKGSQTLRNIERTKEFGVNVASEDQATQVSIAGGYSGVEVDKLKIKNIFNTLEPKKITIPLIKGCIINIECVLTRKEKIGDHVMIIGKVVHIIHDDSKRPLLYHKGRYFGIGPAIEPDRKAVSVDKDVFEFFKSLAGGKFILKCVGVVARSKNKILVIRQHLIETIPLSVPSVGENQKEHLLGYLKSLGLDIHLSANPVMRRLTLKHEEDVLRINLVLFDGKIRSSKVSLWKSERDRFIRILI